MESSGLFNVLGFRGLLGGLCFGRESSTLAATTEKKKKVRLISSWNGRLLHKENFTGEQKNPFSQFTACSHSRKQQFWAFPYPDWKGEWVYLLDSWLPTWTHIMSHPLRCQMWGPALVLFSTWFKGCFSILLWCRFSPDEAVLFQAKWHTVGQQSMIMPITSRAIQFRFSGLDVVNSWSLLQQKLSTNIQGMYSF